MRSDYQKVKAILEGRDPAAGGPLDTGDQVLERLLANPPAQRRLNPAPSSPIRRIGLAMAAAAVTFLAAGFALHAVGTTDNTAFAATPTPLQIPEGDGSPAEPKLEQLSEAALRQQQMREQAFHYVKLRAWYLDSAVEGGSVSSQLSAETIEHWQGTDGSSRTKTDRDGTTDVVSTPADSRVRGLNSYSADPRLLADQILGYPAFAANNDGIPDAAERVERVVDLLRDYGTVQPDLQSALWRILKGQGLSYHGSMEDRAGRRGLAFTLDTSYSGLPTRYLLIIDPGTARLLSFEEILTTDPGKLNVRVPAVLEYEIFLERGEVADETAIPAPAA